MNHRPLYHRGLNSAKILTLLNSLEVCLQGLESLGCETNPQVYNRVKLIQDRIADIADQIMEIRVERWSPSSSLSKVG